MGLAPAPPVAGSARCGPSSVGRQPAAVWRASLVHGGTEPDGAALLLVVLGLLPPSDPWSTALVDATIGELGIGEPVVALRRYPACVDAGFDGVESAFVPVSWWAVSALAQLGRRTEAHTLADRLCEATPGLQPEMVDPDGDGGLGNTPLVWSHAEAARALYLLRVADLRARWRPAGARAWQVARFVRQLAHGLRAGAAPRNTRRPESPSDPIPPGGRTHV